MSFYQPLKSLLKHTMYLKKCNKFNISSNLRFYLQSSNLITQILGFTNLTTSYVNTITSGIS